ncbi:putative flavoprotein reductase [Burkholderia pseudomallei]|nr:putative flavoprotein reductase [Burkholderia pseudomallei]
MMLAHQLASKLFGEVVRGDVRITLLSDSPEHCYEPAFMCVAFGAFFRDELARDERSLLRPEIAFVVDRATHFDFAAPRVHATSGKCYGYDHLVIATGCVPSPERIEGLAEAGDHFYPYEPARRLAERIAPIERGTVFVTVTFPKMHNMPHQCGIAPIETTLMLDDLLRRRGVRSGSRSSTRIQLSRSCCAIACSCKSRPATRCPHGAASACCCARCRSRAARTEKRPRMRNAAARSPAA